ncbi:hypothetical protein GIB67_004791 [Kingdonia uniflora]|uniref:Uncharacterized protein n=1 Tax=Kingdonia uniflora TaxID=39325 RepID=A0A7J7LNJ2_9MAGN|nr:hypothetical protein GIB67_004791 [Kingdonia uniflora]
MESNAETGTPFMRHNTLSQAMQIDPRRSRFPYCIVWTPIPVLSWLIPFIGHIGICREDGVILDFSGPNFVCVDNFTFGSVARFIQMNNEKCCTSEVENQVRYEQMEPETDPNHWDTTLRKSMQEFQHRSYNLLTCNCHSFVANNLNRLTYNGSSKWNVVNLAVLIFLKGQWVNKAAIVRSFLPFAIIFSVGLMLGGWTFVSMWAFLVFVLFGWFLLGTYCFKSMILL